MGRGMTTGGEMTTGEGDDYRGDVTIEGPVLLSHLSVILRFP